jgi:hypothetical protein
MSRLPIEARPLYGSVCYDIHGYAGVVARNVQPEFAHQLLDLWNVEKAYPLKFELNEKLEELKSGQWWVWSCDADMSDGSNRLGSVQSDGHMIAEETWQEDDV